MATRATVRSPGFPASFYIILNVASKLFPIQHISSIMRKLSTDIGGTKIMRRDEHERSTRISITMAPTAATAGAAIWAAAIQPTAIRADTAYAVCAGLWPAAAVGSAGDGGDAKRLVDHAPFMHLSRWLRGTSFLYGAYRCRRSPVTHSRWLWHLGAGRPDHDHHRRFSRCKWPAPAANAMRIASLKSYGKASILLLLPVLLVLVPTSWLENRPSLCLVRTIFGIRCPGCGMSRAISCVFHGDFKKAFRYNRLVVVVFPLLCYIWLKEVVNEITGA